MIWGTYESVATKILKRKYPIMQQMDEKYTINPPENIKNLIEEYNFIDEINNMLFAAYAHGGDGGGSYGSEEEWVKDSIEKFLKKFNLENEYTYSAVNKIVKGENCNFKYFGVPQIVKILMEN